MSGHTSFQTHTCDKAFNVIGALVFPIKSYEKNTSHSTFVVTFKLNSSQLTFEFVHKLPSFGIYFQARPFPTKPSASSREVTCPNSWWQV